MQQIIEYVQQADRAAEEKMTARWDMDMWKRATNGRTLEYKWGLQSDALALCGSPCHQICGRKWSQAAQEFLLLFVD